MCTNIPDYDAVVVHLLRPVDAECGWTGVNDARHRFEAVDRDYWTAYSYLGNTVGDVYVRLSMIDGVGS